MFAVAEGSTELRVQNLVHSSESVPFLGCVVCLSASSSLGWNGVNSDISFLLLDLRGGWYILGRSIEELFQMYLCFSAHKNVLPIALVSMLIDLADKRVPIALCASQGVCFSVSTQWPSKNPV